MPAIRCKPLWRIYWPYDYEPPSYWLEDKSKWGGAWGYNTETGPGPAIPPLESLKKMLPKEHLWPVDEFWNFHAAGERFKDLSRFNEAMSATYGPPSDLEDHLRKAQAMAYEGERAMFEAYGRTKYTSTGVIQWMLNNAWPSIYWHLYDYYMYPAGGYFGTRKAYEPLHVRLIPANGRSGTPRILRVSSKMVMGGCPGRRNESGPVRERAGPRSKVKGAIDFLGMNSQFRAMLASAERREDEP